MPEFLTKLKQQSLDFWNSLSKNNKIKLVVGSLLILALVSISFTFLTRTNMVLLVSDISHEEARAVTNKLDELQIAWRFGATETTIFVDERHRERARLEIYMVGGTSYSLLQALNENSGLGLTDEDKRQRSVLGKAGDIQRALEQTSGIKAARVNLDVPENSPYVLGTPRQPSASIQLILEFGVELTPAQIKGMENFIATSVSGMKTENITIIDGSGKQINGDFMGAGGMVDHKLRVKMDMESHAKTSIKDFLETVYGYGNVDVRVSVRLDFDSVVTTTRAFSPPIDGAEEGLIRTLDELKSQQTNSSTGGVPGVDSNTDNVAEYPNESGTLSSSESASRRITYELNEINQQIIKEQGQVSDITVAVIINKEEMDASERRTVENLIKNVAGVDTKSVVVMNTIFTATSEFPTGIPVETSNLLTFVTNPITLIILVLLIAALIGVFFFLRERKRSQVDKLMAEAAKKVAESNLRDIDPDGADTSEYKQKIERFIMSKPEAAAQLLKNWLSEE